MKNTVNTLFGIFLMLINSYLCFSQVGVGNDRMLIEERMLENPFEREEKINSPFSDKRDSIRSSLMPQKPKAIISITGKVYVDFNENQIFDNTDIVLPDIEISLYSNEIFIQTALTDDNGTYFFDGLEEVPYSIFLGNLPEGLSSCSPDEGSFIPSNNQNFYEVNLCVLPPEGGVDSVFFEGINDFIGGIVYFDNNNNGIKDTNEEGASNVEVLLLNSSFNVIEKTTSDANGEYLFSTQVHFSEGQINLNIRINESLQLITSPSIHEINILTTETPLSYNLGIRNSCDILDIERQDCIDDSYSLKIDFATDYFSEFFNIFIDEDEYIIEASFVGETLGEINIDGLFGDNKSKNLRMTSFACLTETVFKAPCCLPTPFLNNDTILIECGELSSIPLNSLVEVTSEEHLGTWVGHGVIHNIFDPSIGSGTYNLKHINCRGEAELTVIVEDCDANCAEISISNTAQQLNYTDLWTFEVNNESPTPMDVRFEVEVFDEEKGISVYKAQTENVSLPAGGEKYNKINYHQLGKITLDEEIMNGNQSFIKALSTTQKVPPSTYRITVRTLDEDMNICSELSSINSVEGIKTFTSITPPILTHPFNGDTISNNLPLFIWEATAPIEADRYYFKMVEVSEGTTPVVAINNSAYWREEVINPKTQVPYNTNARPLEVGKTYAWRVVPEFDQASNLPTPSSEIYTFTYHPTIDKEDTLNIVEQFDVCDFEIQKNLRMIAKNDSRKRKKIKAALVYTNKHPQDTLLPWKLTVDYEIRFKDREEVELGQFVVSPQRPIDVYEIFDEEPYLFDKEAVLNTNEVSLTVTNVQRFPIESEIPPTICLELSIDEDENRHEKLSDFLLYKDHKYSEPHSHFSAFRVFPNKTAFELLYHLNPSLLYKNESPDTSVLVTPEITEKIPIEDAIFEKTIRKFIHKHHARDIARINDKCNKLKSVVDKLPLSLSNTPILLEKNSLYKRSTIESIYSYLIRIQNGKTKISEIGLEELNKRTNFLINLIRKGQEGGITDDEVDDLKATANDVLILDIDNFFADKDGHTFNNLPKLNHQYALNEWFMLPVANNSLGGSFSNLGFYSESVFVKVETLKNEGEKPKANGLLVKAENDYLRFEKVPKEFTIPDKISTPIEEIISLGDWVFWAEHQNGGKKLGEKENRILLPGGFWKKLKGLFIGHRKELHLLIPTK